VQVHDIPPLYVHVQLLPVQSACHVLPRMSWHIVVVVVTPPVPPLPVPEHAAVAAVGLGMAGHTLSGTQGLGGGWDEPASLTQPLRACSWVWHPTNTVPIAVHTGSTDAAQFRKAINVEAQPAVMVVMVSQRMGHAGSGVDARHPTLAILEQTVAHSEATWAGEQSLPHLARGPASAPAPVPASPVEMVAPPHATVDARANSKMARRVT
jgi:hypothetical protein